MFYLGHEMGHEGARQTALLLACHDWAHGMAPDLKCFTMCCKWSLDAGDWIGSSLITTFRPRAWELSTGWGYRCENCQLSAVLTWACLTRSLCLLDQSILLQGMPALVGLWDCTGYVSAHPLELWEIIFVMLHGGSALVFAIPSGASEMFDHTWHANRHCMASTTESQDKCRCDRGIWVKVAMPVTPETLLTLLRSLCQSTKLR